MMYASNPNHDAASVFRVDWAPRIIFQVYGVALSFLILCVVFYIDLR